MLEFKSLAQARKETGLSYIGCINNSTKHMKAYKYNELVYTIYLSPANRSGFEVCAGRTAECTALCLNESGRNRIDVHENKINRSRNRKTALFFTEHQFFMEWVIKEIESGIAKAKKLNYRFSVRLNNTSDISPELFKVKRGDKRLNLLQLFPEVQFYDYTKIPGRLRLMEKYDNYDVTFSFSGENMDKCKMILDQGITRVAMVFEKVPETYMGFEVIDGDKYDMRYLDPKNVIVGLKYKKVRNKLGKDYKFVISE